MWIDSHTFGTDLLSLAVGIGRAIAVSLAGLGAESVSALTRSQADEASLASLLVDWLAADSTEVNRTAWRCRNAHLSALGRGAHPTLIFAVAVLSTALDTYSSAALESTTGETGGAIWLVGIALLQAVSVLGTLSEEDTDVIGRAKCGLAVTLLSRFGCVGFGAFAVFAS